MLGEGFHGYSAHFLPEKDSQMTSGDFASIFEATRPELLSYVTRLVVRHAIAAELVQEVAVRALSTATPPPAHEWRPWLFRVATRLALDYRRKHGTWRENMLLEAREAARTDARFTAIFGLRGTPETKAVAREHLAVCFSCVLGALAPEQAAALLLREVYDFSLRETADWLEARETQVKNWIQQARQHMNERYATTCALIHKQGVCYQCVELDDSFAAGAGDPLAGTAKQLQDRLELLRRDRTHTPGPWPRLVGDLLGEMF